MDQFGTNFGVRISDVMTGYFGVPASGFFLVTSNTTPETTANTYMPGCICLRTDSPALYQNTGSFASPSWTVNGTGASGASGASGVSGASTSGVSGATGASGVSGFSGASGASGVSGA